MIQAGNTTFLGGIYEEGRLAFDFQKFQVVEHSVLDSIQYGFDLLFSVFRENGGKLDGLLYKKEGAGISFARFLSYDIQFHTGQCRKKRLFGTKKRGR